MSEQEPIEMVPATRRWRTGRIVQAVRWMIVGVVVFAAAQWLWATYGGDVAMSDAAVALDGVRGQDDVVWAVSGPFLISGRVEQPGGMVESGWWLADEMVAVTPDDDAAGWSGVLAVPGEVHDDVPWRPGVELLDGWLVAPHDRVVPLGEMRSRRTVLSPSGVVDGVDVRLVELPADAGEMLWTDETVEALSQEVDEDA